MLSELLVFDVGGVRFGFQATEVREVLRAATVTPLAEAPPVVAGALNLRGRVIPVLNARRLFGFSDKPIEYTDHFIVFQHADQLAALHVDQAVDLVTLDEELVEGSPAGATRFVAAVARTADGLTQVADPAALLSSCGGAVLSN